VNDAALRFESYGVSHPGCVRQQNEDSYLIEPASGLWAVADGIGGHEAGEVASASIVAHLATVGIASSAPDLRARFEDRLTRAHEEIRTIAAKRGVTIGSTIAALLAMNGNFACFWSGDSRIYLVRDGAISQISRDHTEVQELLDRGMISPSEARTWPRRNVITRAVGVSDEIVIDVQQGETLPGDVFVLMYRIRRSRRPFCRQPLRRHASTCSTWFLIAAEPTMSRSCSCGSTANRLAAGPRRACTERSSKAYERRREDPAATRPCADRRRHPAQRHL
jgi:hypothetical protein